MWYVLPSSLSTEFSFTVTSPFSLMRSTMFCSTVGLAQRNSPLAASKLQAMPVLHGTPVSVFRRPPLTLGLTASMPALEFQRYHNGHRAHAGLEERTPEPSTEGSGARASVRSYRWQSHCHGLCQTPM